MLEVKSDKGLDKRNIAKSKELQQDLVSATHKQYPDISEDDIRKALDNWLAGKPKKSD